MELPEASLQCESSPPTLFETGSFLFATVHTRLANQQAPENSCSLCLPFQCGHAGTADANHCVRAGTADAHYCIRLKF